MRIRTRQARRRGAIIPLAAILMVAIVGMVAFAVDIGWVAVSQSELQNSADSAALAGAGPLMDGYVLYHSGNPSASQKTAILSNALTNARNKAKEYAGYNSAGGVSSLTLLDSDIEFGYMDASNNYTAAGSGGLVSVVVGAVTSTKFPNTIKVTMRRDTTANGKLSLSFGGVLGTTTTTLNATASATLYGGTLNNLAPGRVLPLTFDVDAYNTFLSTGLNFTGGATTDSSGNPTLQVYGDGLFKDKGNFGLLSLNDSHTGSSTIQGWVDNGPSQSDINALQNSDLIPLSAHDQTQWDWRGDPGFQASVVMAVNDYAGQTFVLPLFKPYDSNPADYNAGVGEGSNYDYNIVKFVGVRIMPVSDTNREIVIQPAPIIVADTLISNPAPIGSNPTSNYIDAFTAPKLTR